MFRCVLLVEPVDVLRAGLAGIIRHGGIALQLMEARSIHNAVRTMHGQKPDLVLAPPELLPPPPALLTELALPQSTPVCAIMHHHLAAPPQGSGYAATLSIFDNQEVWLSRMRQLKMHQHTPNTLTDREREVLRLLTLGLSNKEVANMLGISSHTVIAHRKNIVEKTDIRSLAGLTLYAIINGVVNIDEIK
ncbi:MAG: hypothetical protein IJU72_00515 [Bacteroidales bacterium]|nr:hypothetical protein [Bacteroidales bacterium]